MTQQAQVHIEIDPFALRRHLELAVVPDILKVGPDEHLCHVPIPQFIGLRVEPGRGLQMQLLVLAGEEKIEVSRAPARAYFGAMLWDGKRVIIPIEHGAGGSAPKHRVEIAPVVAWARNAPAQHLARGIRGEAGRGLACSIGESSPAFNQITHLSPIWAPGTLGWVSRIALRQCRSSLSGSTTRSPYLHCTDRSQALRKTPVLGSQARTS